ncbi:hypothetical protein BDN67DRAFT_1013580 [Paxillus ammoniavirescens]|nr:hypothetical protein BDN67DRAFT_1013580 [Paxillus ammoniavirescens]
MAAQNSGDHSHGDQGSTIVDHDLRADTSSSRSCGLIPWCCVWLVVVQLVVFSLPAWAFVGYLKYYGLLHCGDSLAGLISRHQSATTLLVTMIATVISVLSSLIFTTLVRQALASRAFVMRMTRFCCAINLCLVILNNLTTVWATLLTPSYIVVDFDMTGQELDLGTLRGLARNGSIEPESYPGPTETSPLRWSFGPDITPPIDVTPALSWGTSAGFGVLGVPSMQTVQLFGPPVFNISTGGVFPAVLANITDIVAGAAVTAHVDGPYIRGLSSNYTIVQQGFTVDVVCRNQSFSDTGSGFPSMTLSNASLPLPPLSQSQSSSSSPLVSWAWTTNCTAYSSSYVGSISVSNAGEYPAKVLAGAVCPFQDFDGPSNQSALLLVQSVNGSYRVGQSELTMVCEVTPIITTISVEYSGTIANVTEVVNQTRLNADGSNWPLLLGLAEALAVIFYSSQGMTDNYVVNSMIFTMAKLGSNDVTAESMLESYVRGMAEYWATMHRTLLYIQGSLTDDMMIPMSGKMHVTTMGWQYEAETFPYPLALILAVTLLTITAACVLYYERHRVRKSNEDNLHDTHQSFDPSDSLHAILVSGSEGFDQAQETPESLQVQLEVLHDKVLRLKKINPLVVENVPNKPSSPEAPVAPV